MSIEKVNEVPFFCRKRQRGKLAQYWSMMGFIFQIVRDIDPKLKYAIDTFTLLGLIWSTKIFFGLSTTFIKGNCYNRHLVIILTILDFSLILFVFGTLRFLYLLLVTTMDT